MAKRRKKYDTFKTQNGFTLHKRSKEKSAPYHLDVTTATGERVRVSTRQANKEFAAAEARLIMAKELGLLTDTITWDKAVEMYEAERGDTFDTFSKKWLSAKISDTDLSDIDRTLVNQLIVARRNDTTGKERTGRRGEVSEGTITKTMAVVRAVLNFAKDELELLQSVPKVPRLRSPKSDSRADLFLTPEQFGKLRNELPEHLRALATFAVFTLLRKSNVLQLKWENVNLERHEVYIEGRDTKTGKRQMVPLAPQAYEAISAQVGKNPVYVWTYAKGGRHLTQISTKTWKSAVKRAELDERITFHHLRHTGASWIIQQGGSESELLQAGGWQSPAIAKRYAKLRPQDAARTFGRLAEIEID